VRSLRGASRARRARRASDVALALWTFATRAALALAPTAARAEPQATAPPPPAREGDSIEAPGPTCAQAFIERVYRATKPSVVRITRPDGGLGTGFVFHSPKHVATALHVVDLGRGVRVEFPGDKATTAEVVAWDDLHDLALLELAEPAEAPPLRPRQSVAIGAPILAIGNPYGSLARGSPDLEGLLNFSVSQGIVSARAEAYLQTDAMLSPGNSGGPMLTCDGQVVAIADRLLEGRIGFGVPVVHLEKLTGDIGKRRYLGDLSFKDGAIGLVWQRDVATYVGPYLGGSLVAADRASLTTRFGIAFAGRQETSAPVVDRSVRRLFAEAVLGWRLLLFPYAHPTYVTLGAGVLGTLDRGEETVLRATLEPAGCQANGSCAPALASATTRIRGGGIMPLGQAVLHLGTFELSYGYALDVVHPDLSTHRLLVGLTP
jgi:S1-C subfamily serine protease